MADLIEECEAKILKRLKEAMGYQDIYLEIDSLIDEIERDEI